MSVFIQIRDAEISVVEPKDGVRVLVLRDPETGIVVNAPMPVEAAEAVASRLTGSSLVVPGPPAGA